MHAIYRHPFTRFMEAISEKLLELSYFIVIPIIRKDEVL